MTCVQSRPANSRRNCAALSVTAPSRTGGQVKRPLSSRLLTRHNPEPSQIRIFSRSDPLGPEHENVAGERIGGERLHHQRRQGIHALAEIDRPGCNHDPQPGPRRNAENHRARPTCASTCRSALNIDRALNPHPRPAKLDLDHACCRRPWHGLRRCLQVRRDRRIARKSGRRFAPLPPRSAGAARIRPRVIRGAHRFPTPRAQQSPTDVVSPCDGRDAHAGHQALGQDLRLLLGRPSPPTRPPGDQLDPPILVPLMPVLMPVLITGIIHRAPARTSGAHPRPLHRHPRGGVVAAVTFHIIVDGHDIQAQTAFVASLFQVPA